MAKATVNTTAAARAWNITGTNIYGATKEELKAARRKLNSDAGINEVETKKGEEVIAAAPSNTWPFRITKGPDHPHNAPRFDKAPIGATIRRRGFDVDVKKVSATEVYRPDTGATGLIPAETIVDLV